MPPATGLRNGDTGETVAKRWLSQLDVAQNYYVASEMVDLAVAASIHLADKNEDGDTTILEAHDPPSPFGWMWLAKPLSIRDIRGKTLSMQGCFWSTSGGYVNITWFVDEYDMKDDSNRYFREKGTTNFRSPRLTPNHLEVAAYGQPLPRSITAPSHYVFDSEERLEIGKTENGDNFLIVGSGDDRYEVEVEKRVAATNSFLYSVWRLMRQTLVSTQPLTDLPRQDRRRLDKANVTNRAVTVIELRRREGGRGYNSDVNWSHRFLVRGHWRRQWYPSDKTHRWVYILDYIKGDESLPLLVREHVTALLR